MTDQKMKIDSIDAMPPADWISIEDLGSALPRFDRVGRAFARMRPFGERRLGYGKLVAPPSNRLRRLSDDTVTVSSHLQIVGQGLVGGGRIALCDSHSLRVLEKQSAGHWLIVSEMYMDARTDQSYAGHS